MKLPIYLDYAATTPVDPRVAEKMFRYLTLDGVFGNAASRSHRYGWQAEEAVDVARNQVADLINADPREIIFTSGATESDNLAIKGIAQQFSSKGRHIVTCSTEHKAVLDSCYELEKQGFDVTYLAPQQNGLLDPETVAAALRDDTILVSVMHVNNETGVIQDIAAIGNLCRARQIVFHVDATQSVGKIPVDLAELPVDLLSFSAHKLYGPKGIGGLFVRRQESIRPLAQMHGGGHERGMRSGTLPVHQIVGMGEAYRIAREESAPEYQRLRILRQRLWNGLQKIDGLQLNGHETQTIPGILNVSIAQVDSESLMMALKDLALSSGSACNSATLSPSYVLTAMGLDEPRAYAALRFSFGRFTTEEEIDYALALFTKKATELRE
ncbi:MAG: Cysteine desulfurase IscS [Candidatus Erwinia impunctatus]|nr:Cysteine desulfurase IscS [Culicoides impunctatus]